MCIGMSTRFSEAIPLNNIKANIIIKAPAKFSSFVGVPIHSDQDSNFMLGLLQQVMYELGVKQYKSTVYHPKFRVL